MRKNHVEGIRMHSKYYCDRYVQSELQGRVMGDLDDGMLNKVRDMSVGECHATSNGEK